MPQDRKGDVHLRGTMLVVLPHGPDHPRQGRQEAAIDGRQRRERRLFGSRQVGPELGSQRGQDLMQQRRIEHEGCFTERPQRCPPYAEPRLHLRQRGRLLQAPQARHRRVEKVQEQQGRVLIVEQLPVAGPIPLGADCVQMVEQRPQQAKVLKALQVLCGHRRR